MFKKNVYGALVLLNRVDELYGALLKFAFTVLHIQCRNKTARAQQGEGKHLKILLTIVFA